MNKTGIKFIRGNWERREEIRQILCGHGITMHMLYRIEDWIYYFGEDKVIHCEEAKSPIGQLIIENCEELFLPARFNFKIGDKVVYTRDNKSEIGEVIYLNDVCGTAFYQVQVQNRIRCDVPEYCLELYAEPKFKVGDCVQVTEANEDYQDMVGVIFNYELDIDANKLYHITSSSGEHVFSEVELELYDKGKIKVWEDLEGTPLKGFYIDSTSDEGISEVLSDEEIFTMSDKATAATEAVAKSMRAMAMISQLMPFYGGEITDEEWEDALIHKYEIGKEKNRIKVWRNGISYGFFTFHTKEQAEEFLANNRQLVEDYLMISHNEDTTSN